MGEKFYCYNESIIVFYKQLTVRPAYLLSSSASKPALFLRKALWEFTLSSSVAPAVTFATVSKNVDIPESSSSSTLSYNLYASKPIHSLKL